MIAIDTSAIVAIAFYEPEARIIGEVIVSEQCVIGWPTVLESRMVLSAVPLGRGVDVLDKVLEAPKLKIVPFDHREYESARLAFERYGRGRHRAELDFGDCFSYAVAKVHDVPLLYKGAGFGHTDIRPALP